MGQTFNYDHDRVSWWQLIKIQLLILCGLLVLQNVEAQNTSNKGKDFWLGYAAHIDGYGSQMSLYITSTLTTSGTVSIPGRNYSVSYSVNPDQVTIVNIPVMSAYVESSESIEDKGINVTAEDPVVVYAHIYSKNRSGASLVLPTNTLGREYYTIGYTQKTSGQYAQFMVVGVEDSTLVEITPTSETRGGHPANEPFTITLMKGQVYQVQAVKDLTGSKIQSISTGENSCKRIAVFSGSSFTPLGCPEGNSGDNLYQQLYPISAWGSNFVTAPMETRKGGDIFRIVAGTDGTVIKINDSASVNLGKGEFYDFQSDVANFISSNNPVILAQFPRTQGCDRVTGDPEMIILSPVEQQLKKITLYSSPYFKITGHYINILMKTSETSSFTLDGAPVNFTEVPANPEYSFSQNKVSPGNHTLSADHGFNAVAYGFGNVESYGYSAGANIKNLTQNITFSAETYCDGETAGFQGFASYTPESWKWYFGDGTVSEDINPQHRYAYPGTYTVSLVTVKNNGNDCDSRDSTSVELTVYPNPKAEFTYDEYCEGDTTQFQDLSTTAFNGNEIISWFWDFGDGTTSNEQHPKHKYGSYGTYNVKLQVVTGLGCANETAAKVQIHPLPEPDFGALPVCESDTMRFQDRSTVEEGEITNWTWDFGTGSGSSMQNPVFAYDTSGTISVTLQAGTSYGCTNEVTKDVLIYPMPSPGMTLPGICIKDEAEFINTSEIASGEISYLWEFGDGDSSILENPKHKYTAEGVYNIKLNTISDKGCQSSIEEEYTVSGAEPIPAFIFKDICQKDTVRFKDTSSIAFGNIISWKWDFGDGASSEEQHPVHLYDVPGIYNVQLTAHSGIICKDTISKTIEVLPSPDAAFATENVCVDQKASFINNSGISPDASLTYQWDFGDSTGSSEPEPEHSYNDHGTYTVTLLADAETGCRDSITQLITIHPVPDVRFSPDIVCQPEVVDFTDESTLASGNNTSWNWIFGDGGISAEQQPSHQFTDPGFYEVSLEVVTDKACRAILQKNVEVVPAPVAIAGDDQVPLCGITSTRLSANVPAPASGEWTVINGSGGEFSDTKDPKASFSGEMGELYSLRWTVHNNPCPDATDELKVKFSPIPQVDAGEDAEIIEGETITLSGSGDGTLIWAPDDGSLSGTGIPNPEASPKESVSYILQATTPDGCTETDEILIRVLQRLRIPTGISPNNDGRNDQWEIKGVEDYPDIQVEVFNRWGDKVFSSTGYDRHWDGSKDGQQLSDGVYYFIIDIHRDRAPYTGSITILR